MFSMNATFLITSAVNVSSNNTKMVDSNARAEHTLHTINTLKNSISNVNVVVCDGSNFDFSKFVNHDVECLSFQNDINKVRKFGKGYGEGEIVQYAINNSQYIKHSPFFAKCTGKLNVQNLRRCLKAFNGNAGFDYKRGKNDFFIDTRFYIVDKDFFKQYLLRSYLLVNEGDGFYLEHAYYDALHKLRAIDYIISWPPFLTGWSGSMGVQYKPNKIKHIARIIRNHLTTITNTLL